MSDVIAVDVDLRRIHAWSKNHGQVCYKSPDLADIYNFISKHPEPLTELTVIMEVASAVSYQDGDAAKLYQKRRWMIYNMAIAGEFSMSVRYSPSKIPTFLVSPSHEWTHGYSEEVRQHMAKADAKNHDLRECQTMIHMYSLAPKKWYPYQQYLDEKL